MADRRLREMTGPADQREDFSPGGSFTVGVEEELFLLDARNQLSADSQRLVESVRALTRDRPGTAHPELYAAQIEFASAPGRDAEEVVPQLHTLRRALADAGGRALACGLHPAAPFERALLSAGAHYDQVADDLAGLLRTPTAALQVHVGLPDEEAALRAYRGLRNRLAVLQALAGNSPFWHGIDSGLASARWAVIGSYPRGGVPPVLHTWDDYAALVRTTADAARTPDHGQVWWDARLRPRLGTIEVRVMDAQPSLAVTAGLAALVQGLARHAVEHPTPIDLPDQVLAENSFRVARHGLETTVVDIDGTHRPVRELVAGAVRDARAALSADVLDRPLEAVEKLVGDQPEYARQRDVHARAGLAGLVEDLVARTVLA